MPLSTALGFNIISVLSMWADRPALPDAPVDIYPLEYAGKSAKDKIADIRTILEKKGADSYLFTGLDEIAWIFNIRCSDVEYNPVVIAFGAIDKQKATLFVSPQKISHNVAALLADEGIEVAPYNAVFDYIATLHELWGYLSDVCQSGCKRRKCSSHFQTSDIGLERIVLQ